MNDVAPTFLKRDRDAPAGVVSCASALASEWQHIALGLFSRFDSS